MALRRDAVWRGVELGRVLSVFFFIGYGVAPAGTGAQKFIDNTERIENEVERKQIVCRVYGV